MKKFASPLFALFLSCGVALAEIPTVLTDAISKGTGTIDLMKDVTSAELQSYLQEYQSLYLGIDVNENASGTESSTSQGVAIKQIQLLLTTTAGEFTFSDFVTTTSAMLLESGSTTAQSFYTAFGTSGSNDLTPSTTNFDISRLDDVITLQGIQFTGDILSAKLNVSFVQTQTGKLAGANEDFFDFTGGFEDFAILAPVDARLLELAAIGEADAPSGVETTQQATPITVAESGGSKSLADAPAAPTPSFWLLLAGAALLAMSHRRAGKRAAA